MKTKAASKSPGKNTVSTTESIHDKIARQAYEIYEQRGREHGKDVEHWLEAEEFIMGSKKKRS